MAQLFSPRADARLRLGLVIAALLGVLLLALAYAWPRAGAAWAVGQPAPQPLPFSHAIHAGGLGLDCGFCHVGATRAADAGMPAGEVCLSCHQRLWNVTAQFAPVQDAVRAERALTWASVHRLPDHVRFHHGAHAAAGVSCATCHGAVERMPQTVKAETLSMGWCLDCHRATPMPTPRLQPFQHAGSTIHPATDCTTCHR